MIFRLIYASTLAAPHLESTVEDVLLSSCRNNLRAGLTGMLICDGVSFAQVLEGEHDAVEACFERIARNDRHKEVLVRSRELSGQRRFERWSMCGLSLSPLDDALMGEGDFGFDLRRLSAGALSQHLLGISIRHAAELDARYQRLAATSAAEG